MADIDLSTASRLKAAQLFDLSGRVAIVTGGTSGLGRDIAAALLANGARVLVAGRHAAEVDSAPCRLGACQSVLEVARADLTDPQDVTAMFERCEARFGPATILVNAAGIGLRKPALETAASEWTDIAAINTQATFAVSQEAARRMIDAGTGGSIIGLSSFLAEKAVRNTVAYAASKAALEQMTRCLALEWARHGIRVNAIAPGWFPTPMTEPFLGGRAGAVLAETNPLRRLGRDADLAGAALLLASDAGSYITGTTITVDGGQSIA